EIPITLLAPEQMNGATLARYNVLLMPNGDYNELGKQGAEKIKNWVRDGGTVLARGGAMSWLASNEIADFKFNEQSEQDTVVQRNYAAYSRDKGSKVTGGAISNVRLDVTHPIGYGYTTSELFSFRSGNQFLEISDNPYAN